MNGRPEVVKDGDGRYIGLVNIPYSWSGKTTLTLARIDQFIRPYVVSFETAVQKLKDTNGELQELMEEEVDVAELPKLRVSELNIETNKLSPSQVAALLPVLEGDI